MDSFQISFYPIVIQEKKVISSRHRVTYNFYISEDPLMIQFGKNCDKVMFEKAFPNRSPRELLVGQMVFDYNEFFIGLLNHPIFINFPDVVPYHTYHGTIVAVVESFPADLGFLTSERNTRVYYENFKIKIKGGKFHFQKIIIAAIALGSVLVLFIVVRGVL